MKTLLTLAACIALTGPAFGQTDHAAMHHNATASTATARAEGTIRKVDKAAAKLTIAHGPLDGLGMPAMTMAFRVKDVAMLDAVKTGDKVRFVVANVDGSLTVMSIETLKQAP